MFAKLLPAGFQEFLGKSNINLESLFELFTGKASPRKIAATVTPLIAQVSPAIGDALEYLEKKYDGQLILGIYNTTDDTNKRVEGFSVCRINADNGQLEFLENYAFSYLPNFVVDKMEEAQAQKSLPPAA
jgi:hypothetical protein